MARPKKITYPCDLEAMLRQALPFQRREARLKFYRMYIRDFLHKPAPTKATEEEIDQEIIKNRAMKFEESYVANIVMRMYQTLGQWQRELRKKKASTASKKRWSKS